MTSNANPGPIMLGISTTALLAHEINWLSYDAVGGVILFTRNFTDVAQLCELVKHIRHIRPDILIGVDQEGGRIQRFHAEFTRLPSFTQLGQRYDEAKDEALVLAQQTGWLMASELLACGIDISFSPLIDCAKSGSDVLKDRTFHAKPDIVATLARAYSDGMHQAGMISVLKHFPGHGGVKADSHTYLPIDKRSFDALWDSDLVPFRQLASQAHAMMVAHILFPAIDADMPAGYSPYWLQTILRDKLAFNGAIFSDDLDMAAATIIADAADRVSQALAAGCDMVLLCNEPNTIDNVIDAVLTGKLRIRQDSQSQHRLAQCRGQFAPQQSLAALQTSAPYQQAKAQLHRFVDNMRDRTC